MPPSDYVLSSQFTKVSNGIEILQMTQESPLRKLIASLQKKISANTLDKDAISNATKELEKLGYKYDDESFPRLVDTEKFTNDSGDAPKNLAEALLWKLGKWKAYKKFCEHYFAENPQTTQTDVVFYAFARHLRDNNNPIYDQHAIRSLWAIGNLTAEDRKNCKALLFNKKNEWKQSGTGNTAVDCYTIFVKHVDHLVSVSNSASKSELDRLLMPLGQAIKKSTKTYADFEALCGWSGCT